MGPLDAGGSTATKALREAGPYLLEETLGEGGMGVVYRAHHRETGEPVAVKLVRLRDENVVASIRREIFALRSLEHPGIVRIVADGVSDGRPWYAMELLLGDTLEDRIRTLHGESHISLTSAADDTVPSEPRPDGHSGSGSSSPSYAELAQGDLSATVPAPASLHPPELRTVDRATLEHSLRWVRALCEPLAYVHGKGLVHRDLKPGNVFICDGIPVLADFGLALRFGGQREVLDVAGRALGTPPYMAPEQIRGDLVDARADLYALGCILYECLTGTPPFEGRPMAVLHQHLHQQPTPPSHLADDVPRELDSLVLRLLAKHPRDRIGYAADVARTLLRLGVPSIELAAAPEARAYLYRPRLAGRAAVIEVLERRLPRDRRSEGSMVVIAGPSGVGKTRLATELATTAARRGLKVVISQGSDGTSRVAPLGLLRPLLTAIADRCRSAGKDFTERVVGARGPILAAYEPALVDLPGQRQHLAPVPLPLDAARTRLLEALVTTVQCFARQEPTLLVLDDAQWADELSLAVLDSLAGERLVSVPLTILLTLRSDEIEGPLRRLTQASGVATIDLRALNRNAVSLMVGDMLAMVEPPSGLIEFLMRQSEGNPFFIAEYLRVAIDAGVLRRDDMGAWGLGGADDAPESLSSALPLPRGLRDLVERRLSLLSDAAEQLVELASVLGRELDAELMFDAASLSEQEGLPLVEELRGRQLLEEGGSGALRFVHDTLRELIYERIERTRRSALHAAVAIRLEARLGSAPQPAFAYPRLAHHFEAAGDPSSALRYLELAGEHALASSASEEARGFFARALKLAGESSDLVTQARRARWERRLGEASYNLGDLDGAQRHLSSALARWEVAGSTDWLAALRPAGAAWRQAISLLGVATTDGDPASREAHRESALAAERLAQTYFFMNRQRQSFASALRCADHATRLGSSAELARGYAVLSVGLGYLAAPPLVKRYGTMAERIAEDVGDRHAIGFVAFMRGLSALGDGRHADARRFLRRARAVAFANGDIRALEEITPLLSHAHSVSGRRTKALELDRSVLDSALRTRNAQAIAWGRATSASTLTFMGRAEEAAALFEEIDDMVRTAGDRSQILVQGMAALDMLMLGRFDEARRIADETSSFAGGEPPAGFHCYLGYIGMCEVYLAEWERLRDAGERVPRELTRRAEEAVSRMARHGRIFRLGRPHALTYQGLLAALRGRSGRADRCLKRGLDLARALDLPTEQGRLHYEIARRLSSSDPRRRQHRSHALACLTRADESYWRERAAAL